MKFRSFLKLVAAVWLLVALAHVVIQTPAGFVHLDHKAHGEERP